MASTTRSHTVPHGDRSKVAIEPFLTDQWFVDAAKLAGPALAAVRDGRTRILPEQYEKVYYHWLENIEPWCIRASSGGVIRSRSGGMSPAHRRTIRRDLPPDKCLCRGGAQ